MRFPLTERQALIICRLINKKSGGPGLRKSEAHYMDMVALTQVGAIKITKDGLIVTEKGMRRFMKWHKKNEESQTICVNDAPMN